MKKLEVLNLNEKLPIDLSECYALVYKHCELSEFAKIYIKDSIEIYSADFDKLNIKGVIFLKDLTKVGKVLICPERSYTILRGSKIFDSKNFCSLDSCFYTFKF